MKIIKSNLLFLKLKSLRTGKYLLIISALIYSCSHLVPQGPAEELLMNAPLPGLSNSQLLLFQEGAAEFDEVYTQETGLGPIYVSNSCASCHKDDNRGHPFTMLVRFGQHDTSGNQFLHLGGPQLQHQFIPGFQGEIHRSAGNDERTSHPPERTVACKLHDEGSPGCRPVRFPQRAVVCSSPRLEIQLVMKHRKRVRI